MKKILGLILLSLMLSLPAWAQSPTGQPLLTVTGKIQNTNAENAFIFDRDMLQNLPQGKIVTHTPWYDEVSEFEGPLARAIVEWVQVDGAQQARVYALNDYSAVVPVSDLLDLGMVFATQRNGETLRVRDKGPIFLVYPFDDNPNLNSEVYHNRSVWQIKSIEFF